MPDFNRIRYKCERSVAISDKFVDKFLLPFCDAEEGLNKKFAAMLSGYLNIIQKMPENWPLCLTAQYIAFRLFRSGGLALKYYNHLQVRRRSEKELDYLKFQVEHPWRFGFCFITQIRKGCFFEMKDVLTGEEFLLFSPSIAEIEEQKGPMSLYFLLIGFNGECWQTYGVNNYFKGIQPLDLLYFAKQLRPDLVSLNEIPALIDENPVPFMMLWVGAEFPLTVHKNDPVVAVGSSIKQDEFPGDKLNRDFIIEQKPPVYQFSLKRWHKFPHYCSCYYDAARKIFCLNAMTDRGYAKLVEVLDGLGYQFPREAETRVTMAMFTIAKEVLGRKLEINPYEKIFREKQSPATEAELGKMNSFLKKLSDALNSGVDYDLRELAFLAGIELETAKEMEKQIVKKFKLR